MRRRTFLTAAAAAGLTSFAPRGENHSFAGCGSPGARLPQPGRDGYFARWPKTVRAVVDFAHPWREPQDYLVHCHSLEHEDGGMMLGVRVA